MVQMLLSDWLFPIRIIICWCCNRTDWCLLWSSNSISPSGSSVAICHSLFLPSQDIPITYPAWRTITTKFSIGFPSSYLVEKGSRHGCQSYKKKETEITDEGDLRLNLTKLKTNIENFLLMNELTFAKALLSIFLSWQSCYYEMLARQAYNRSYTILVIEAVV